MQKNQNHLEIFFRNVFSFCGISILLSLHHKNDAGNEFKSSKGGNEKKQSECKLYTHELLQTINYFLIHF